MSSLRTWAPVSVCELSSTGGRERAAIRDNDSELPDSMAFKDKFDRGCRQWRVGYTIDKGYDYNADNKIRGGYEHWIRVL